MTHSSVVPRAAHPVAPRVGIEFYTTQTGGPLIDRLFLDGIEVDPQCRVSVIFDFGDLDQPVVQLVAISNWSVNGSVHEQESEHDRHGSPDSRWATL